MVPKTKPLSTSKVFQQSQKAMMRIITQIYIYTQHIRQKVFTIKTKNAMPKTTAGRVDYTCDVGMICVPIKIHTGFF